MQLKKSQKTKKGWLFLAHAQLCSYNISKMTKKKQNHRTETASIIAHKAIDITNFVAVYTKNKSQSRQFHYFSISFRCILGLIIKYYANCFSQPKFYITVIGELDIGLHTTCLYLNLLAIFLVLLLTRYRT